MTSPLIVPYPRLWLLLFALGTILPLAVFVPWLDANGLDIGAFLALSVANPIATFFTLDVVISALAVLAAAWLLLPPRSAFVVSLLCLTIGVSSALPLMLWFLARLGQTQTS